MEWPLATAILQKIDRQNASVNEKIACVIKNLISMEHVSRWIKVTIGAIVMSSDLHSIINIKYQINWTRGNKINVHVMTDPYTK